MSRTIRSFDGVHQRVYANAMRRGEPLLSWKMTPRAQRTTRAEREQAGRARAGEAAPAQAAARKITRPVWPAAPVYSAEPADQQAVEKLSRAVQSGQSMISALRCVIDAGDWERIALCLMSAATHAVRAAAPFANSAQRVDWLDRVMHWTNCADPDADSRADRRTDWLGHTPRGVKTSLGADFVDAAAQVLQELEKWIPEPEAPLPWGPARAAAESAEYEAQIADVLARQKARGVPRQRERRDQVDADREQAELTRAASQNLSAQFERGAVPSRRLDRYMSIIARAALES